MTDYDKNLSIYEKKGFAKKIGIGKSPAVIVIDMIEGFTNPKSKLGSDYSSLITNINRLLIKAREKHMPIFLTTVAYQDSLEGGNFIKKVPSLELLVKGSKWVEIDSDIKSSSEDIVIEKKYASAFFGTTLASMLTYKNVDTVIITGVTTSGCVRASAIDALQYGYKVIVPEDCVADRLEAPHKANLFDINSKYGDVVTLDDLLKNNFD